MSHYERTLFYRMKILRRQKSNAKYDAKYIVSTVAEDITCGLAQIGTPLLTEDNGRHEVKTRFLVNTLFSDVIKGDELEISADGLIIGTFIATKPYPVMDREGIHHYEILVEEKSDA